jgi:hypothetical protein
VDGIAGPDGPPGWFFAADLAVLRPRVRNRLAAVVTFPGGFEEVVALPEPGQDTTVSPRLEAGYRLAGGLGDLLLAYRLIDSEGSGLLVGFDPFGIVPLRSRLNLNVLDFDYASREWAPAPHWDMKWRVGARLANSFYDVLAEGPFLAQRASSHFIGAGPHLGLGLHRHLPLPGWSVYLQTEGALVIGRVHQGYEETMTFPDGPRVGSATSIDHTHAVPTLGGQLGVAWMPAGWQGWRFSLGYQYEHWWYLGTTELSQLELGAQGLFLRGEYRY